jgi:hypothetical protein
VQHWKGVGLHAGAEPGSSVSIVSGYGLDDRAIEVRSPAEAKDFSSNLCVQTGSGARPGSYPIATGGPFLGLKRGQGVTLTTHPYLVPRSCMSRSCTMACCGTALPLLFGTLWHSKRLHHATSHRWSLLYCDPK